MTSGRTGRIRRAGSVALALAVGGLLGCASGSSSTPPVTASVPTKPWDQAAMTTLSADLAKASEALYTEYWDEQGGEVGSYGSGQGDLGQQLKQQLDEFKNRSQVLTVGLSKGKGRAETQAEVAHMGEQTRYIQDTLRQMFLLEQFDEKLQAARAIWVQMLPYYGMAAPPPLKEY